MKQRKGSPSPWLSAGLVAAFFALALFLRVYLPYDKIFTPDGIRFAGVDAYYHIRLVDNLVQHFPQRITFDPYTSFPYGAGVIWAPFFDWLLGGIIWLVSLGKPTQHTVDLVGVYFPTVLAALVTIPVFFIGRLLANNRWAGVLAAGLVAIMPGEYMGRSILGFTDHHVAEALFSTVAMLFLLLAVKSAAEREWSFRDLWRGGWKSHRRPLVYSFLAGVFLGIYFLTWTG
ncbi:MAG: STT3 domain-containing protein, partial [Chloroflexota bacterium]